MVDDEPLLRRALQRVLCASFEVLDAEDGQQALDWIKDSTSVQVILSNIHMPNMDGIAFHERLAQIHPQLAKQMLFLTGGMIFANTEAFYEANKDRILLKPPNLEVLHNRLLERVFWA